MIWLFAGSATLSVVVQALSLVPALRRTGFRYRPRWGLRGVEDLGAGNQALFVLESGFQWDSGNLQSAPLFNRQSYVGLQNKSIGKLTFATQSSAGAAR